MQLDILQHVITKKRVQIKQVLSAYENCFIHLKTLQIYILHNIDLLSQFQ